MAFQAFQAFLVNLEIQAFEGNLEFQDIGCGLLA
jgi:hypothetical protein